MHRLFKNLNSCQENYFFFFNFLENDFSRTDKPNDSKVGDKNLKQKLNIRIRTRRIGPETSATGSVYDSKPTKVKVETNLLYGVKVICSGNKVRPGFKKK